jgi:hypothetical protein
MAGGEVLRGGAVHEPLEIVSKLDNRVKNK